MLSPLQAPLHQPFILLFTLATRDLISLFAYLFRFSNLAVDINPQATEKARMMGHVNFPLTRLFPPTVDLSTNDEAADSGGK